MDTNKNQVRKAPFGIYESWTPFQQKRPQLYVAALLVDQRERVLVVKRGGEWTLPQQMHHHIVGILPAFEAICQSHELWPMARPKAVRLYDPYDQPTPSDPVFAVVRADVNSRPRCSLTWVSSAEELMDFSSVHPLVLAAAQAGLPTALAWQTSSTSISS